MAAMKELFVEIKEQEDVLADLMKKLAEQELRIHALEVITGVLQNRLGGRRI